MLPKIFGWFDAWNTNLYEIFESSKLELFGFRQVTRKKFDQESF